MASTSSQRKNDLVVSTKIETQTAADLLTSHTSPVPPTTPKTPSTLSTPSTPSEKHLRLIETVKSLQKSNGKYKCQFYLQKIFSSMQAAMNKKIHRFFAKWACYALRMSTNSLQNDILASSRRFREQLENVKGQFAMQIETTRRENDAVRAELSDLAAKNCKLLAENEVFRSLSNLTSNSSLTSSNLTPTDDGISKRRRNSIQNEILRNEKVTPEVVLARRREDRKETMAQQHKEFNSNLRSVPSSTPFPAFSTPRSVNTGSGFAKLEASAKRAAQRLQRSPSLERPHRNPPPTPTPTTPTMAEQKTAEVNDNINDGDDASIIPVDNKDMERMAEEALNFFGGNAKTKTTSERKERKQRRIISLDAFMNRKLTGDM